MEGKILACCISDKKGVQKKEVPEIELIENYGVKNDAHAGGERQVSLLAIESVKKAGLKVPPGAYGENLLIEGIDTSKIKLGTQILIGNEVLLEITHLGKKCHTKCAIFYAAGKCIMPIEGIFAKVIKGGRVNKGDKIRILVDGEG